MRRIRVIVGFLAMVMLLNITSVCASEVNQELPYVVSIISLTNTSVEVRFSEEVTVESAENEANYMIMGLYGPSGLIVIDAQLDETGTIVTLTTSEQAIATLYRALVNNVLDLDDNIISDQKVFAGKN